MGEDEEATRPRSRGCTPSRAVDFQRRVSATVCLRWRAHLLPSPRPASRPSPNSRRLISLLDQSRPVRLASSAQQSDATGRSPTENAQTDPPCSHRRQLRSSPHPQPISRRPAVPVLGQPLFLIFKRCVHCPPRAASGAQDRPSLQWAAMGCGRVARSRTVAEDRDGWGHAKSPGLLFYRPLMCPQSDRGFAEQDHNVELGAFGRSSQVVVSTRSDSSQSVP